MTRNATDTPPQALENALQDKISLIEQAAAAVRNNHIDGVPETLDKDVAALCRNILALEAGEARRLEGKMLEMINRLDDLAAEIRHYQERRNDTAKKS